MTGCSIRQQLPRLAQAVRVFYSFPMLGLSILNELRAASLHSAGDANAPRRFTDVSESDLRQALRDTQLEEFLAVMCCNQMEDLLQLQSYFTAICNDAATGVSEWVHESGQVRAVCQLAWLVADMQLQRLLL